MDSLKQAEEYKLTDSPDITTHYKKASNSLLLNAVQLAVDSLNQAQECILTDSPDVTTVTLSYVESVAKFRYTLETVAWLLHDYYLDHVQFLELSKLEQKIMAQLLSLVQNTCSAVNKESSEVVPNLLIKCIVRKYGMSTLIALRDINKTGGNLDFSWLIPKHLQKGSSESQVGLNGNDI